MVLPLPRLVALLLLWIPIWHAPVPAQCSIEPLSESAFTVAHARHLLARAGFGGTPSDIAALHARGLTGAVRFLVDYEELADPLPGHGLTPVARPNSQVLRRMAVEERERIQAQQRRTNQLNFDHLRGWWIERMLKSRRPLEEKMTLLWHGHLTSGMRDVGNAYHLALQNDLLRRHGTESYRTLVSEISRDPAMLRYLNNNRNVRRAPNENYARELMELFTLGLDAYTEDDVKAAARAFTGWTFVESQYQFRTRDHDYGEKTFLGEVGSFDGDDVVRIILEQPAASQHVARTILSFFAKVPTDDELAPYANLLARTDYALKPLLRSLFSSKWFYSDAVVGSQIKSPLQLVIGTLRVMDAGHVAPLPLARVCDGIGQAIFEPPNVKGWEGGTAWITSSHLLARYNIQKTLIATAGRPPAATGPAAGPAPRPFTAFALIGAAAAKTPEDIVTVLSERFLDVPLSAPSRQVLTDFLAGADGSPTLDLKDGRQARVKLDETLHLLMTTPEYQLH